MAKRSPYTTYTTERVSLIGNPEQRSTGYHDTVRDQQFINFFPTVTESPINGAKAYRLKQRNGLSHQFAPSTPGVGRGLYYYNGFTFSVSGNTLYKDGVAIQVLATSTGSVGFIEYAGTNKYLILLDGISGWTIDATTFAVVQITDVDFPTPHCVQAAYLDGYLFVAKSGTDDIYNSNLNDPLTWTTGDFLSAEMYPDNIVSLRRQNNYIVAIGVQSMEYFYDSGVTPGTPLARNSAAAHTIGCPAPNTIVASEEQIIFIGQTGVGGKSIWIMNGFQPTQIGIEAVNRAVDNENQDISLALAFCVRSSGHRFYVLTLLNRQITWVYDFDTKMWHQWTNSAAPTGGISTNPPTEFVCGYACDYVSGAPLMQHTSNGRIYQFTGTSSDELTPSTYTPMVCWATSGKYDFGTANRKFMSRFSIICDIPSNVYVTPAPPIPTCTVSWTDDDYKTWSTPQTLSINDSNSYITQLGSFRRRAFRIVYTVPPTATTLQGPLFLEGFEVDINMGIK